MTLRTIRPLPEAWPVPEPNRKLSTPLIVLRADEPLALDYPRDLIAVDDDVTVLVPWEGQWRTETFQTTVRDLARRFARLAT